MSSEEDSIVNADVKKLPHLTGVYLMKDSTGKIIYVGKAKDLNKRVRSYFKPRGPGDPKTAALIKKVKSVDYITTGNEVEALVLECNLIKENKPVYNVRLKDDKKYPYIKLTSAGEYPRLVLVRNLENDGSEYFGPYTDAGAVRKTLSIIGDIFPLRRCSEKRFMQKNERECLYFQIGKCSAPCTGRIKKSDYMELVRQVKLLLSGKNSKLAGRLKGKMERLSAEKKFEKAAAIRDQIKAIDKLSERQIALDQGGKDEDVIAFASEGKEHCAVIMKIREGRILSSRDFILPASVEDRVAEIASGFIKLYYHSSTDIPPDIYLDSEPSDKTIILEWLVQKAGHKVHIRIPKRGRKKRLLDLARSNARVKLLAHSSIRPEITLLNDVKKVLGLSSTPLIVEGYDISNIQGEEPVGSMVTFRSGNPDKKYYRRFKIRSVTGQDDYAMLSEVISRRFSNIHAHGDRAPDLILIDGGRGQVNAAINALKTANAGDIPVVGLAKKEEKIYLGWKPKALNLSSRSGALKFLQRVRNEAHRFAIDYHRKLRLKRTEDSVLDLIQGIGRQRKLLLLLEFGSIDGISEASVDELSTVPGIGENLAKEIHRYFRKG